MIAINYFYIENSKKNCSQYKQHSNQKKSFPSVKKQQSDFPLVFHDLFLDHFILQGAATDSRLLVC